MTTQSERITRQLGPFGGFTLTEGEAQWLACAIDSEGCIGIWRQRDGKHASGFKYRPAVQITNTNFDYLAHARSLIDGYVVVDQHPKNVNPKHKVCYRANVNQRAVLGLLEQISPYLIIKKRQAEFVMQFCKATHAALVGDHSDHELYEQLYLECKVLNKRGS